MLARSRPPRRVIANLTDTAQLELIIFFPANTQYVISISYATRYINKVDIYIWPKLPDT